MMSLTRQLIPRNFAFLLVGFIALLAIVAANFWLSERAQSYFDEAIVSRDMRVAAVELRNALQTAEASERGFLITANEIYLAPFQGQRVAERTQDLAQARDRAEVLLAEVNHRVANSLSLVSSLVRLQSKSLSDKVAKEALAEIQDRIFAISLIHKRLYGSNNARFVKVTEYFTGLLEHLQTSHRRDGEGLTVTYQIDPFELETDKCISLGVIITELVTNAVKYAYPDGIGEVRVKISATAAEIEAVVEDDGVGRVEGAPPTGTGVGTKIINAMAQGLGTDIRYKNVMSGTSAYLRFTAEHNVT